MTTITMTSNEKIEGGKDGNGCNQIVFSIKLSEKTSWTYISTSNSFSPIQLSNDMAFRVFGTLGKIYDDHNEAVAAYKSKKLKAALEFLPEYIAQGMTGEVTI